MPGPTRTLCAALSMICLVAAAGAADASERTDQQAAARAGFAASDVSSQARATQRTPRRVRIYGRSRGPGPNSVRICNAHYEQEFRPSGTVIVPRMHCYWSG